GPHLWRRGGGPRLRGCGRLARNLVMRHDQLERATHEFELETRRLRLTRESQRREPTAWRALHGRPPKQSAPIAGMPCSGSNDLKRPQLPPTHEPPRSEEHTSELQSRG